MLLYLQSKLFDLKWIGAILGFFYMRFGGAIIGFLIGSILDRIFRSSSSGTGGGFGKIFQEQGGQVSPGDFELNLLSLSSLVIKADGKVTQQEMDFVRMYFVQAYGKERANATFRTFNEVIKNREISADKICNYLRPRVRYEVRLQILHFLFNISNADGHVSEAELQVLLNISQNLQIANSDFESIKAMFFKSADNAYKILEIEKSASDSEVKKAYRAMAKKFHPDKLQHMDEVYRKGAQEKFNKVQEAYEQIQKERGL
ncbi:TerB family tellurite resistance protein [Psychroflexus sediminis]|uniref:DnaJ like chaperone protein n=1 Tax=Psychroflexus sediminis TaxID=470826 RepID=A0A1G7X6U7_9FLAO|nr:TerB family tellurite resistance protein [Psychroflexus sediminis]SDG79928.1 DnaJ like chaperone protein [Psychroflexus sediminis]